MDIEKEQVVIWGYTDINNDFLRALRVLRGYTLCYLLNIIQPG
jgi:hypothetical protein